MRQAQHVRRCGLPRRVVDGASKGQFGVCPDRGPRPRKWAYENTASSTSKQLADRHQLRGTWCKTKEPSHVNGVSFDALEGLKAWPTAHPSVGSAVPCACHHELGFVPCRRCPLPDSQRSRYPCRRSANEGGRSLAGMARRLGTDRRRRFRYSSRMLPESLTRSSPSSSREANAGAPSEAELRAALCDASEERREPSLLHIVHAGLEACDRVQVAHVPAQIRGDGLRGSGSIRARRQKKSGKKANQ
jgi:hypothetical protein